MTSHANILYIVLSTIARATTRCYWKACLLATKRWVKRTWEVPKIRGCGNGPVHCHIWPPENPQSVFSIYLFMNWTRTNSQNDAPDVLQNKQTEPRNSREYKTWIKQRTQTLGSQSSASIGRNRNAQGWAPKGIPRVTIGVPEGSLAPKNEQFLILMELIGKYTLQQLKTRICERATFLQTLAIFSVLDFDTTSHFSYWPIRLFRAGTQTLANLSVLEFETSLVLFSGLVPPSLVILSLPNHCRRWPADTTKWYCFVNWLWFLPSLRIHLRYPGKRSKLIQGTPIKAFQWK